MSEKEVMMQEISGVKVTSIACCVPKQVKKNIDVQGYDRERIEKIIQTTGVEERRVCDAGCCASDLCLEAANHIINRLQIDRNEIGALIFVSQTPDYRLPATACVLHSKLGLPIETFAFDVNLGCSGYIYGTYLSSLVLQHSKKKYALLLVGDVITNYCSDRDASTVFLFGDAGSASLLEKCTKDAKICFSLGTDGSGWRNLVVPAGGFRQPSNALTSFLHADNAGNSRSDEHLFMDGMEIFNFAISSVVPHIQEMIDTYPRITSVFFHQANRYMLEFMRKSLKIDREIFHYSLQSFGNTSSASIPLTICHNKAEADLTRVLLCGFGVGYSWGSMLADLSETEVSNLIEWG